MAGEEAVFRGAGPWPSQQRGWVAARPSPARRRRGPFTAPARLALRPLLKGGAAANRNCVAGGAACGTQQPPQRPGGSAGSRAQACVCRQPRERGVVLTGTEATPWNPPPNEATKVHPTPTVCPLKWGLGWPRGATAYSGEPPSPSPFPAAAAACQRQNAAMPTEPARLDAAAPPPAARPEATAEAKQAL